MRAGERKNRGAAVIEFAILLPLLAIIVFGILEFGFIWLQSHYIANAAREGARIAAKLAEVDDEDGSGQPYVQAGVRDYLLGLYRNLEDNDIEFHCCGLDPSVTPTKFVAIVVEEGTLADFDAPSGLTPEPEAVQVRVTVQTSEVWKPILWGLLAGIFGGDEVILNQVSESAVFAREN